MKFSKLLFSFEGRINRAPYWGYSILSNFILILLMLGLLLGGFFAGIEILGKLAELLFIPMIWISFALIIKRLHDLDKNGWLGLIMLIPIVNLYIIILLLFFKGTEGKNKYGDNPLGINSNPVTAPISNLNEL